MNFPYDPFHFFCFQIVSLFQYATMKWILSVLDTLIAIVHSLPPDPNKSAERRLEEFRRSIMRLRNVNDGLTEILSFSSELFQTSHVGILIWDEDRGQYISHCTVKGLRSAWNVYDPFFVTITDYDRVILLEEMVRLRNAHDREVLLRFFQETQSSLILPLILNETVIAVLFVGPCHPPAMTVMEDFRTYAVLALSNSVIYTRLESLLVSLEDKVRERTQQLEEATKQMIQSEKMATLGVMVAGIAHELNTPSGVILNASENLLRTLDSFLDRIAVYEWLRDESLIHRFVEILRFFNYHLLTGNPSVPSGAFQLRRRLKQALEESGVEGAEELASFFVEYGFVTDMEAALSERTNERLKNDSLFGQIVSLYREIDQDFRSHFIGYLRDLAAMYRNVKNITASAAGIARLVKALRMYSRSGTGDFVKARVEELLDTTLEIMGSIWKNQVQLERQYAGLPEIQCDPDRLNQVWSNLLMNAYHAVRGRNNPAIMIFTESMGDHVRVRIHDNGPGIPEAIREKIWDPFFTTKEQGEGTGLGLSIVRRIVEEHGGTVRFTTDDHGTEFIVDLPIENKNRSSTVRTAPGPGRYDWR
jgi:signal transduction histidine kinase